MQLTQAQASAMLAQHANNHTITEGQLAALLGDVSVTFAQINYVTQVTLAAEHRNAGVVVNKVTTANVMLFGNVSAASKMYRRKVQRSADKYASNSKEAIDKFEASKASYTHTTVHSLVHNDNSNNAMLYCFYNRASSVYVHNNTVVTKQHVAAYCTPSAAKALLNPSTTVHNVTHNITHDVQVRTIALRNIVSIRARKQLLTV